MKCYALALDLVEDQCLIAEYEALHQNENCWPEVKHSIMEAGIRDMRIYRTGNRLFMVMEVDETFSFAKKAEMDANNEKVQEWEQLMWRYQKPLPWADPNEKWVLMDLIYSLNMPEIHTRLTRP